VVFDKTGTLTTGVPELKEVLALGGTEGEVLAWAAQAGRATSHPLGRAAVEAWKARGSDPGPGFEVGASRDLPGRGNEVVVEGRRVAAGSEAWLRSEAVDTTLASEFLADQGGRGRTVVLVAVDGVLAGVLAWGDSLKPEAVTAVEALRTQGKRLVLLTGDSGGAAADVARALGIEEVHAGVLPDAKHRIIEDLKARGRTVVMVGDGVNDAPALAAAHVGVALGTGTEAAIEAGDIVLLGGDLGALAALFSLARQTGRKIRQNLFWAFAYNVAGIPIAALGLLSPLVAAAAMALSSVSVLANSLSLARGLDREVSR